MGLFDSILDIGTLGLYGAVTGKGFDITGKGAAADALSSSQAAQKAASDQSLALQQRMYDESVARNKPFYEAGVTANADREKLAHGGYDMQESPAAQYQMQQGSRSLNRQLAAKGLLGSGNANQKMAELSAGVAGNDFNNQWQRLTDLTNTGTGSAQQSNAASQNLSTSGSGTLQNQANATSSNNTARSQLYTSMSPLAIGADIAGAAGSLMGGMGKLNSSLSAKPAGGL